MNKVNAKNETKLTTQWRSSEYVYLNFAVTIDQDDGNKRVKMTGRIWDKEKGAVRAFINFKQLVNLRNVLNEIIVSVNSYEKNPTN